MTGTIRKMRGRRKPKVGWEGKGDNGICVMRTKGNYLKGEIGPARGKGGAWGSTVEGRM